MEQQVSDKELREYLNGGMRDSFTSKFAEDLAVLRKEYARLKAFSESQAEALDLMEAGEL